MEDRVLVESLTEDLHGLRDQSTEVQNRIVDAMMYSEDDEELEMLDSLGDLLEEVKSQISQLEHWIWR